VFLEIPESAVTLSKMEATSRGRSRSDLDVELQGASGRREAQATARADHKWASWPLEAHGHGSLPLFKF
jgi:hypothetical protein